MAWAQVGNIKGPAGNTGSTGTPGTPGAPGVGFTWRGTWVNSTAYAINDTVSRTNQSYVCIVANTGNDPAIDTTHWNLMAAAGAPGSNACTTNASSFTIPSVGQTVQVTVQDASWIVVGQMLVVSGAGGSANLPGTLQVTAISGNLVTFLNPTPSADAIATGTIWEWAGSTAPPPDGWLNCDGSAVSRTTYSALFGVIGTSFGAGDGSTTFNVPWLIAVVLGDNSVAGTIGNVTVYQTGVRIIKF